MMMKIMYGRFEKSKNISFFMRICDVRICENNIIFNKTKKALDFADKKMKDKMKGFLKNSNVPNDVIKFTITNWERNAEDPDWQYFMEYFYEVMDNPNHETPENPTPQHPTPKYPPLPTSHKNPSHTNPSHTNPSSPSHKNQSPTPTTPPPSSTSHQNRSPTPIKPPPSSPSPPTTPPPDSVCIFLSIFVPKNI